MAEFTACVASIRGNYPLIDPESKTTPLLHGLTTLNDLLHRLMGEMINTGRSENMMRHID
ncbi:hypothetical protein WA026_012948 [Henosepilachna vigintioctopunctata]|uniref:Uncharacterized protein n=1 Tax=Henosepilachna vigintioctopunctata TaxID=420089 RepID=A0AAW1TTU8_9CUCU